MKLNAAFSTSKAATLPSALKDEFDGPDQDGTYMSVSGAREVLKTELYWAHVRRCSKFNVSCNAHLGSDIVLNIICQICSRIPPPCFRKTAYEPRFECGPWVIVSASFTDDAVLQGPRGESSRALDCSHEP